MYAGRRLDEQTALFDWFLAIVTLLVVLFIYVVKYIRDFLCDSFIYKYSLPLLLLLSVNNLIKNVAVFVFFIYFLNLINKLFVLILT